MQQVIEDQAIILYDVGDNSGSRTTWKMSDYARLLMRLRAIIPPCTHVNGSAKPNVLELDAKQLAPFEAKMPPKGPADVTRFFTINQTGVVTWVVDGYPYSELKTPIIYGNTSEVWAANTTLHMPYNSTVDIIMRIANDSMDPVSWTDS